MLLCHVIFRSVRPELVEGGVWFDTLTTNDLKLPVMRKHDKVKLRDTRISLFCLPGHKINIGSEDKDGSDPAGPGQRRIGGENRP